MKPRYRWYVAAVMFAFLLLHQADKLLIGPLTTNIMEDFQINTRSGVTFTTASPAPSSWPWPP